MNITVTGAIGEIGREVTKFAVKKGYNVNALDISSANITKLGEAKEKVTFYEGDILDKASIEPALESVDAVIITIRLSPAQMQSGLTYDDVEFGGIRNIVDVAKQKDVKKIVFISAEGVSAECVGDMYQAKFKAEESIRNSGIDYTILRSSGLYKDFDLFHIPQVLQLGENDTWPFGPIEYHFSPLSHIDLARCLVDSVENPAAVNKTIRMGGPDSLTYGEFLTMIAKEAGINAHYTKGVSKEALIEGIRKNPEKRVFTPEQIQDVILDSIIDFKQIQAIFNIEFHRLEDYLKVAVPRVRTALSKNNQ